jgi:hypothetical protein
MHDPYMEILFNYLFTYYSMNPNAMNEPITLFNIFFEQLLMTRICENCMLNREQTKVFKAMLVFFLRAIRSFITVHNADQVL